MKRKIYYLGEGLILGIINTATVVGIIFCTVRAYFPIFATVGLLGFCLLIFLSTVALLYKRIEIYASLFSPLQEISEEKRKKAIKVIKRLILYLVPTFVVLVLGYFAIYLVMIKQIRFAGLILFGGIIFFLCFIWSDVKRGYRRAEEVAS